jgi:Cu-processing system permease protein
VWLFFVLIYDMALLGTLVAAGGHALPTGLLDALLLINPTDAYRLLNLGSGSAGALSGMGGVAEHSMLGTTTLLTALALWTAGPLALAAMALSRREL